MHTASLRYRRGERKPGDDVDETEASAELKIPLRKLRRYVRDGAIRGERRGDGWWIDDAEVTRVREARERAGAAIAPQLAAAEELVAVIGEVRGRAMRDAVTHAREILRLADEWERRAAGGAEGAMASELADTLARHIAQVERNSSVLRGTAATYKALRDRMVAVARALTEAQREPV